MVPEPIVAALFFAREVVRWQPATFFLRVTKLVQKRANRRKMGYDACYSLQRPSKFWQYNVAILRNEVFKKLYIEARACRAL